jgi:DNA polymerase III psi subunit
MYASTAPLTWRVVKWEYLMGKHGKNIEKNVRLGLVKETDVAGIDLILVFWKNY